jgi:DNA-binding transcriptional MerR regulator
MLPKKVLDPGTGSRLYNSFLEDVFRNQCDWRIGKLAVACGVSADTLRHYERKGVLTATRSTNGYRSYPFQAFARVQLVRRAMAMGFTLDELSVVLRIRDHGGVPCRHVRELAAEKLAVVESQLSSLLILRDELRRTLKDWDERLAQTSVGAPSGLLEALAAGTDNPINQTVRFVSSKRNLNMIGETNVQEDQAKPRARNADSRGRLAHMRATTATDQSTAISPRSDVNGKNERARRYRDGFRSR